MRFCGWGFKSIYRRFINVMRQEMPDTKKGRPKEDRETKERVNLSVLPSFYEDIQKSAFA